MFISALVLMTILTGIHQTGIDQVATAPLTKTVSFTTYDSNSTTLHVKPTSVLVDAEEVNYSYSESTGVVELDVKSSGEFTLVVTADGYNDFSSTYTGDSLNGAAVNLVKIQADKSSSGTVTWNHSVVKDLDSHMYIYDQSGALLHEVCYKSTSYQDDNTKVVTTKDDTGGGSGETTTVEPYYQPYSYKFYLHRYSGSGEMTKSDAQCVVTFDNVTHSVKVPNPGTEYRWWHVYDIVDGKLVIVNTLSDTKD